MVRESHSKLGLDQAAANMSSVRPMTAMDLFKFNACNLDHLTETYNIGFYLEYLSKWPHLCKVIEGPDGNIEGYRTASSARWLSS